jgi:hypothetical protein
MHIRPSRNKRLFAKILQTVEEQYGPCVTTIAGELIGASHVKAVTDVLEHAHHIWKMFVGKSTIKNMVTVRNV